MGVDVFLGDAAVSSGCVAICFDSTGAGGFEVRRGRHQGP